MFGLLFGTLVFGGLPLVHHPESVRINVFFYSACREGRF